MAGSNNKLGKNIMDLRKAYGETQMDLAYALGLTSLSAVANYESGLRQPTHDIRQKIAAHYRITEEELMNSDFSRLDIKSFPFDNAAKMREISISMLPIIYTDEALNDSLFKKGYDAHMRIFKDMEAGNEFSDSDLDICLDSYTESYESNGRLESAANCIWWMLLLGMIMSDFRMCEGAAKLVEGSLSKSDFLKSYYLRNFDEDWFDEDAQELEKARQDFLNDSKEIDEMLRKLNFSQQWSDLAYYYTALRYIFCVLKNEFSDDMNRTIGTEMMWTFARLGNKYAKRFLRASITQKK